MSRKAEASAAPAPIFFKTKLCRFALAGRCRRGRDCRYAHGEGEVQALPDFSRTSLCPALRERGFCGRGPGCRFAHSREELQPRVGERQPKAAARPATQKVPTDKKVVDDDDDLDLPNSWSRQSTEEPSMELDFESDEEWEEASEAVSAEVKRRASWADIADDEAAEAAEPVAVEAAEGESLELIASAFGMTFALKNSFLAFGDGEEEPVAGIRRVRSTGALSAVAC